ncbi:MAG: hypothetical protein WC974_09030 [Thermoplasmata archaeon]
MKLDKEVVRTELDEVLFEEYERESAPGEILATDKLFVKQKDISKGYVIYAENMGPGAFEKHVQEQNVKESTTKVGNKVTKEIENWKNSLPVAIESYEDDQHDVIQDNVREMGINARITRDKDVIQTLYGDGFDGTTTPDGVYTWSNSHLNLNGDTIDNLETGTLTPANLETLVKSLRLQKKQDGLIGGHNPAGLAVPVALFPDAQEITKSELAAHTGENQLNYFSAIYPGLVVGSSGFLDSTFNDYTNANTSHYLVSRNHMLTRTVRLGLTTELIPYQYDAKDRWFYKARYREVPSAKGWQGAVASSGTV